MPELYHHHSSACAAGVRMRMKGANPPDVVLSQIAA
jgi:hypothetical protein